MKSTDMMLDVSSATGLGQQTLVAATLHLPEGMDARPARLIFALHGGGYTRGYWHPAFADDSYSFARWFTAQGFAVLAIDHKKVAILGRMQQHLAQLAINLDIGLNNILG